MINGDLSAKLAGARGRLVSELSDVVARWGGQVPEDPGVAELADLLEDAAAALRAPTRTNAGAELTSAVTHLRAADRLGGLLPAVTLWHLRQALQRAAAFSESAEPFTRPCPPETQDYLAAPLQASAGLPQP